MPRNHEEVRLMAGDAERLVDHMTPRGRVSLDELARRKGVGPVESVQDMAQDGLFASDEDLDEFLIQVYEARHAETA
jgi:hypothetical protein